MRLWKEDGYYPFLDPPLHEFVPTEEADIAALAKDMGLSVEDGNLRSLHEFNPMMGHRGSCVTYPEIAECRPELLWKLLSKLRMKKATTLYLK